MVLTNKISNFDNLSAPFIPGKGKGTDFLKNIDVDSELKLLNYSNTLCPPMKYNVIDNCTSCNKCLGLKSKKDCSGSKIKVNPLCENTRECLFNNNTKKYKTKCGQCLQIVEKHNQGLDGLHRNIPSDMVMGELLSANYKTCKYRGKKYYPNCLDKKYFNQCKPHFPHRQPIPYQMENHVRPSRTLRVGPERTEHVCENIWNNVTRREHI